MYDSGMNKLIYLLLVALAVSLIVSAQQANTRIPIVYYTYDAKGNVIKRETRLELDPGSLPVGGDTTVIPGGDTMIIVYPNPTLGPLIAEAPNYTGEFPLHYQLYTDYGMLLQTLSSRDALTEINMRGLPTGVYVLRAMRGETVIGIQVIKIE